MKTKTRHPREATRQLISYALIGGLTNLAGYGCYLLLTNLGGGPKSTMTGLYVLGFLISFFANRKITFRHDGHIGQAGFRYMLAYAAGYMLNLSLIVLFVDWLGYAHQLIQAAAIIIVALFLFALSRNFVFSQDSTGNGKFPL